MMKLNTYFAGSISIVMLLLSAFFELGFCRESGLIMTKNLGGDVDECRESQNSAEIESLGQFAIHEYNQKKNTLLEFTRVIRSREQVAAGTMYHLTLEAIEAGRKNKYEAKVWVKPWMNFRKLEDFEHADDVPTNNGHSFELYY